MKRLYADSRGPILLYEFSYMGRMIERFRSLRTNSLIDQIGMNSDLFNCLYS